MENKVKKSVCLGNSYQYNMFAEQLCSIMVIVVLYHGTETFEPNDV